MTTDITRVTFNKPRIHPSESNDFELPDDIPTPYQTLHGAYLLTEQEGSMEFLNTWLPLSSISGEIQDIVIPLRNAEDPKEERYLDQIYFQIVCQLLDHLPRLTIHTPVQTEEEQRLVLRRIAELETNRNWRLSQVNIWVEPSASILFREWAQDHMIVLVSERNPANKILLEKLQERSGSLADVLSTMHEEIKASKKGSIEFDGGNILADENFVLMGADEIVNTQKLHPHLSEEEIKTLFAEHFHVTPDNIHWIAGPIAHRWKVKHVFQNHLWEHDLNYWCGDRQPIFHLDQFISLAGRNTAGQYCILVGKLKLETYRPNRSDWPAELLRFWQDAIQTLHEGLDKIAQNLAKQSDFHIIRNPLALTYWDEPIKEEPNQFERHWFLASYNNVITQRTAGQSIVFLPSYAFNHQSGDWSNLESIEHENQRIWEQLGYEVKFFGDCLPLARRRGGPHCMLKIFNRT